MNESTTTAARPYADGWCQSCGSPVNRDDTCSCWCLVAEALQRYLGMDFDSAAQMAADLWRDHADKPFVWTAAYAEDHDVDTYPRPELMAALVVRDALAFPHDEECPRCGRRQWGLGADVADPMNPTDAEQETCGACGWHYDGEPVR